MSILRKQASSQPQTAPTNTASAWRWMDALWRFLVDPWLLAVLSVLLLMLILLGIAVPQMPGQLRSEPLAADRWLSAAATGYGVLGGVLRSLGAFDVLRSPFSLAILVATIFVLLMQIADAALLALAMRRLSELLDDASPSSGEALSVMMPQQVDRWRGAVALSPPVVMQACEADARRWAGHVERRMLRVAPAPLQLASLPATATDAPTTVVEERLLGVSGLVESALRPLLPFGMILSLLVVTWFSMTGHSFQPAPLLPGDRASDAVLGLTAEYQLTSPQPGVLGPVLKVTRGDSEQTLPLQHIAVSLDNVNVAVQPGAPVLIVYTLDERALLVRPGQPNRVAMTSLGFPDPGSEQVLLLPESNVGIRLVRQDGEASAVADSFVIEVFQGDSEAPTQRFTIARSEVRRIETASDDILLGFAPIAMFQMQAYTTPGVWLLAPALVLAAVGAYGFRRRPTFLLAQVGPWPLERSVIVLQTNRRGEVEEVRRILDAQTSPVNEKASERD
ncbi:MAG: hypothetical protein ACK47M_07960 [Caldilinea sp.]